MATKRARPPEATPVRSMATPPSRAMAPERGTTPDGAVFGLPPRFTAFACSRAAATPLNHCRPSSPLVASSRARRGLVSPAAPRRRPSTSFCRDSPPGRPPAAAGESAPDDCWKLLDKRGWTALEQSCCSQESLQAAAEADEVTPGVPDAAKEWVAADMAELLKTKFMDVRINDVISVSRQLFCPHPRMVDTAGVDVLMKPLLTYWLALYEAVFKRVYTVGTNELQRMQLVYLRATPGLGKTHFFLLLCRLPELVQAYDRLPQPDQDDLAEHRKALDWALSSVVFPLTFNGICRVDASTETRLANLKGTRHGGVAKFLPVWLRFLFVGIVPVHTSASWRLFLSSCSRALTTGCLTAVEVEAAAITLFQRLQERSKNGTVTLLVDEIGFCGLLPKSRYKPHASAVEGVRSYLSDFAEVRGGPAGFSTLYLPLLSQQTTKQSLRPLLSGCSLELIPKTTAARALLPGLCTFYLRGSQLVISGKVVFGNMRNGDHPLFSHKGRARLVSLARHCSASVGGHSRVLVCLDDLLREQNPQLPSSSPSKAFIDMAEHIKKAVQRSALQCDDLIFGDDSLDLVATILLGSTVQTRQKVMTEDGKVTVDQLGAEGKLVLSGSSPCRLYMPAASFVDNVLASQSQHPLMETLVDMVECPANDVGSIWEDYHLGWEAAVSQARSLIRRAYKSCTVASVYASSRGPEKLLSDHMFCGQGDALHKIKLNFSIPKTEVASRDVSLLLKMAEDPSMHQELQGTVWRTSTAEEGVDGVIFVPLARSFGRFKKGHLFMVLLSLKSAGPGMDGRYSKKDVRDGFHKAKGVIGASWAQWQDRVVFVFVARRSGPVKNVGSGWDSSCTIVCGLDGLDDLYGRVACDVGMSLELMRKTESEVML